MQEALWVLGLLLLACAYAIVSAVAGDELLLIGLDVMLSSAAFGVPLELIYFLLLAWALRANHRAAKGWYWRPFEHHDSLSDAQRLCILPPYYAGGLAFLGIVLGIVICVLGFIGLVVHHST
jgi:hypothetical protein